MKIIKDNSKKTVRLKCRVCRSVILVKFMELKTGFANRKYIECPICKSDIWKDF